MIEGVKTVLPPDPFGYGRTVEIGYTFHGDVALGISYDNVVELAAKDPALFIFSHEAQASIIVWFSCFAWRCGQSEKALASFQWIVDNVEAPSYPSYNHSQNRLAEMAQNKRPLPRFDDVVKGWEAIDIPMVTQPGVLDEVGGTGIFTGKDALGNSCLLLHSIPSVTGATVQETTCHAEFYVDDVAPVIQAIASSAMGEYQNEVWQLADLVLRQSY